MSLLLTILYHVIFFSIRVVASGEAEFQTQREEFQIAGGDDGGVTVEDIGPKEEGTTPSEGNVAFSFRVHCPIL